MLRRIRRLPSPALVIAVIALVVALGGGAYALSGVPDRNGVYHGCVDDKTGALRVVPIDTDRDHAGRCRPMCRGHESTRSRP